MVDFQILWKENVRGISRTLIKGGGEGALGQGYYHDPDRGPPAMSVLCLQSLRSSLTMMAMRRNGHYFHLRYHHDFPHKITKRMTTAQRQKVKMTEKEIETNEIHHMTRPDHQFLDATI